MHYQVLTMHHLPSTICKAPLTMHHYHAPLVMHHSPCTSCHAPLVMHHSPRWNCHQSRYICTRILHMQTDIKLHLHVRLQNRHHLEIWFT